MESTATFDPIADAIVAEVEGSLVAQASVERVLRDEKPVYDLRGFVLPDIRRRGLGRALLHARPASCDRARRGGRRSVPLTIRGFASEHELGHRALLETHGFSVVRWFFLMRRPTLDDIPDAPLPAGIELRPVRPEDHLAIFDAEYEAFRDHWQPQTTTRPSSRRSTGKAELDTGLWVVAWDGDEIAGVVQNWIWRDENEELGVKRGWLEHISVRRPWRRRGLGRAHHRGIPASRCGAAGMTEAMLGVDCREPDRGARPVRGARLRGRPAIDRLHRGRSSADPGPRLRRRAGPRRGRAPARPARARSSSPRRGPGRRRPRPRARAGARATRPSRRRRRRAGRPGPSRRRTACRR